MSHSLPLYARLGSLLAMTLAVACGSPTESTPPPPPPPAEATLAFTMDSSIYLISTDSGATPALLDSGFIKPSWSPDGSTLAMVQTGPTPPYAYPPWQTLYLADADGGNVRALAGGWSIGPTLWSPDGSALLFVRHKNPSIGPISSSSVVRVEVAGGAETFFGGERFEDNPTWSHDGSLIAFEVYAYQVGGTYVVNAVTQDTLLHLAAYSPSFSPVNDDLAFVEPTTGHIHLIRPDSSADRDLQADGSQLLLGGHQESWSPDGKRIAFAGNGGMYTIYPDGSNLTRIGPPDVEVRDLAWSADGQRIAYVVSPASGPASIYMARVDDTDRRAVVTAEGVCCLSWRP